MLRAVAAGAGGGSGDIVGPGSSTNNAIARFDGVTGKLLKGTSGATISDNFALTLAGATVTASEPILNLAQTWNNAAVTFTGMLVDITSTASASASLPVNVRVAGASVFSVRRDGRTTIASTLSAAGSVEVSGNFAAANNGVSLYLGTSADVVLTRDAASVLAQRVGTTAQTHRVYKTYTDASNYERQALQSGAGYFEWAAETLGTGTDDIDLRLTPSSTTAAVDFRNTANGAAAQVGTLTNAPTAGNPAYWLKIRIGGTTHYIPAWT